MQSGDWPTKDTSCRGLARTDQREKNEVFPGTLYLSWQVHSAITFYRCMCVQPDTKQKYKWTPGVSRSPPAGEGRPDDCPGTGIPEPQLAGHSVHERERDRSGRSAVAELGWPIACSCLLQPESEPAGVEPMCDQQVSFWPSS